MPADRFKAKVPEPLQRGSDDWPNFVARVYAQPLLLLAVPYRRNADGLAQPAQKDGHPGKDWPAACRLVDFALGGKYWSALPSADGWRFASSLDELGFDPAYCDGALVLFIVDGYKSSVFDATAAPDDAALTSRFDHEAIRMAVGDVEQGRLEQAATRWPAAGARRSRPLPAGPVEMALVACRYPAGVLDRAPGPSIAASQALAGWLAERPLQRLLVMTGDSIYIDATAGLFDPAFVPATGVHGRGLASRALTEALKAAYREADQRNAHFGNVRARLQSLDDHEIIDNWEPSADPQRDEMLARRLEVCHQAFLESSAREGVQPKAAGCKGLQPLFHVEQVDGLHFFIADTRTERSVREAGQLDQARIMCADQFKSLLDWLAPKDDERGRVYRRIVVSPSMLLPRRLSTQEDAHAALRSDAWDGYPASLHAMLAAVSRYPDLRCVFLSGDEHLPCVLSASVQPADGKAPASRLLSVHAGALYAPWPFANSRPEDFADETGFEFDSGLDGPLRRYRCTINDCRFPGHPGDGFVTLSYPADADVEPTVCWQSAEGAATVLWPAPANAC